PQPPIWSLRKQMPQQQFLPGPQHQQVTNPPPDRILRHMTKRVDKLPHIVPAGLAYRRRRDRRQPARRPPSNTRHVISHAARDPHANSLLTPATTAHYWTPPPAREQFRQQDRAAQQTSAH